MYQRGFGSGIGIDREAEHEGSSDTSDDTYKSSAWHTRKPSFALDKPIVISGSGAPIRAMGPSVLTTTIGANP